MVVEFVNMKDAGDTDRLTMGGMEKGEENARGETEPACVFKVWQKSRDKRILFVGLFCIFRGKVLRMFCMFRGLIQQ